MQNLSDLFLKTHSIFEELCSLCKKQKLTVELLQHCVFDMNNTKDDNNNTLLHLICQYDPFNIEVIKFLFQKNVQPNLTYQNGKTLFEMLCEKSFETPYLYGAFSKSGIIIFLEKLSQNKQLTIKEAKVFIKISKNCNLFSEIRSNDNRSALEIFYQHNDESLMLELLKMFCEDHKLSYQMISEFYLKQGKENQLKLLKFLSEPNVGLSGLGCCLLTFVMYNEKNNDGLIFFKLFLEAGCNPNALLTRWDHEWGIFKHQVTSFYTVLENLSYTVDNIDFEYLETLCNMFISHRANLTAGSKAEKTPFDSILFISQRNNNFILAKKLLIHLPNEFIQKISEETMKKIKDADCVSDTINIQKNYKSLPELMQKKIFTFHCCLFKQKQKQKQYIPKPIALHIDNIVVLETYKEKLQQPKNNCVIF